MESQRFPSQRASINHLAQNGWEEASQTGLSWNPSKVFASNRSRWRCTVQTICPQRGSKNPFIQSFGPPVGYTLNSEGQNCCKTNDIGVAFSKEPAVAKVKRNQHRSFQDDPYQCNCKRKIKISWLHADTQDYPLRANIKGPNLPWTCIFAKLRCELWVVIYM